MFNRRAQPLSISSIFIAVLVVYGVLYYYSWNTSC
jgi:hypothetical protein